MKHMLLLLLISCTLALLLGGCTNPVPDAAPVDPLASAPRRQGLVVLAAGATVCPVVDEGDIAEAIGEAEDFWRSLGIELADPCTPNVLGVLIHHTPDANLSPAVAVTNRGPSWMPGITLDDTRYACAVGGKAAACYDEAVTVLTHEIGHALGLGHTMSRDSIMYPYVQPRMPPTAIDRDLADCLLNTESLGCTEGY